jgi:hypothetical protein
VLEGRSLAKVGMLTLLLGVSTLVILRHVIKHGWLADNTHWLMHKSGDNPDRWYI